MSRFEDRPDPAFLSMNASIDFDQRLWPQDVALSRAHADMLAERGIISADDRQDIETGLDQIERELIDFRFPFLADDEDIHMAIERRLIELVGDAGARLHTARSRNDQVVTDLAMYVRDRSNHARDAITRLMATVLSRAEEHLDWPMPGYTHLQRAQPVYLSHHLLAYFWMLSRDRYRFEFTAREAGRLPLGSGAIAGVNFDTDRDLLARRLDFHEVLPNSIDAVSGRDFVLDYLAAASTCATHLSRLGAEIVLWSSSEFRFCELPDSWSSGSSLMPQKKNPDAAELLRAKAPRVVAHLAALHGVIHALPLTYNKDLQEDKQHLFDAVDTIAVMLTASTHMLAGIRFNRLPMLEAAADEMTAATDVADLLVRHGVPFREAHTILAGLVRSALAHGKTLSELTPSELAEHSQLLADNHAELQRVLEPTSWLESKVSYGATSLPRVRDQIALARDILGEVPPEHEQEDDFDEDDDAPLR
ncbi:MAG TPA: argininosuccinate lyase [Solirubrobacteraceae bacterium]|nr:argininosuccinate lyase [Solirubrobacteraceae bacterium]